MNPQELQADEARRCQEFPVVKDQIYLAHAGVCPLPRRVAQAIQSYAWSCTQGDQETLVPFSQMGKTRGLAAQLLSATPEDIAFIGPTSVALSLVAAGLPWKPGDNVVIHYDDYPSNVYPWMTLTQKGVEVRFLQPRVPGCIEINDVLCRLDSRTRLVSLASSHFVTGYCPDIQAIGRALRQSDVWFCVDAIQTLGIRPLDAACVDFLAADAHKWLLGPGAAGVLYVRKAMQETLRPALVGWHNIDCPEFIAQESIRFKPDARRYEPGSANLLGLVGLHAALELILEVGIEPISCELLRIREWLIPRLRDRQWQVLASDASPARSGGIISFRREGCDMAALHRRLEKRRVYTSLRQDRQGRQYLRLSPHFYNTLGELEEFLSALD
ncbi:MAG TPA: aminotransferase class V-fold PLP-dependent enzyme [Candidatus Paceibacterota bacterium]|nr:aminotransferase class V-fold PLP-dependent enzyme [Verrucomicrobiota bacterium]HRY47922.1 aminotransferase class V-fold PLP-dependent enzyme [Candidatus Paceibacterota bacterium]